MDDERPKPRHATCGARSRQNGGRPCRKSPMKGKTRCKMHGGATPKSAARNAEKHGLYSDPEQVQPVEDEAVQAKLEELRKDPADALLKLAATLMVRIERAQARTGDDGFLRTEREETTGGGPFEGQVVEKQVDVTQPMADAAVKAARALKTADDLRTARLERQRLKAETALLKKRLDPGAAGDEALTEEQIDARLAQLEAKDRGA